MDDGERTTANLGGSEDFVAESSKELSIELKGVVEVVNERRATVVSIKKVGQRHPEKVGKDEPDDAGDGGG